MAMSGRVAQVCVVHALLPDDGFFGITAIDKRPVDQPVKVRRLGLRGDVQADRLHHGGEEQAVYAYATEEADWWADELGREITPGLFGENLRTIGIDIDAAVIGERWRIGSTELEVTGPRVPCATFARRLGEQRWVKRFTDHARTGVYLRVIDTGQLAAGDEIEVLHRPAHGISVERWFGEQAAEDAATLLAAAEAGEFQLGPNLRADLTKRVARG